MLAPDLANVTAAKDAELATIRASGNTSALPDLFCVPLLIKDNYDTVGIATANGAVALLDNFPSQDATIVSRFFVSIMQRAFGSCPTTIVIVGPTSGPLSDFQRCPLAVCSTMRIVAQS